MDQEREERDKQEWDEEKFSWESSGGVNLIGERNVVTDEGWREEE